jgi:hypothetical protein
LEDSEIDAYWYTYEQYDLIKEANKAVSNIMNGKAEPTQDRDICTRGLEHKSILLGKRRKTRNLACPQSGTLDEQARQRSEGFQDLEIMPEVYKGFGGLSIAKGKKRGIEDGKAFLD